MASKLLGGWQFGGIVRVRSGRPFSIESNIGTFTRPAISDDNTVTLSQSLSNDQLRDLTGLQNIGGGLFWLDPTLSAVFVGGDCVDPAGASALFQCPRPGELGALQQTPIYGPSRFTMDFNLAKRIKLTETVGLEFRWEVFNVTNTANFQLPQNDITEEDFGKIDDVITDARKMQFALKINF